MNEAKEIAKAIQESAKLGEKGLAIADKAGTFLAKVFRDPIDEVSGMLRDKLRFIRACISRTVTVNKGVLYGFQGPYGTYCYTLLPTTSSLRSLTLGHSKVPKLSSKVLIQFFDDSAQESQIAELERKIEELQN